MKSFKITHVSIATLFSICLFLNPPNISASTDAGSTQIFIQDSGAMQTKTDVESSKGSSSPIMSKKEVSEAAAEMQRLMKAAREGKSLGVGWQKLGDGDEIGRVRQTSRK